MGTAFSGDGDETASAPQPAELTRAMTFAILFHQLRLRQFWNFYLGYACLHLRAKFSKLPTYQRCVELLPCWRLCSIASQFNGIAITNVTLLSISYIQLSGLSRTQVILLSVNRSR